MSNNREKYISIANERLNGNSKTIMISQIEKFYELSNVLLSIKKFNLGDDVTLSKGTLLHGTYKNIDGLKDIVENGLVSSWFINDGRNSKYASCVGVWKLKKDYLLKDYVDFYSGGTVNYYNIGEKEDITEVIPYSHFNEFLPNFIKKGYLVWKMEQTKEARFLPCLVQDKVQLAIIINGESLEMKEILKGDILDPNNINDVDVKPFVDESYYENFIKERINKNDFFTDRESAVLFGIPSNFIEGVLVGRIYEKDNAILDEIKSLLPNAYICNIDGKVIRN